MQQLPHRPPDGPRAAGTGRGPLWLAAALALGAAILAVALVRDGPRTTPPLRVAINAWPGYEFATLAQELGYFEEEGVDVRVVELGSLGDCRRAFERGQVDGFFATLVEVLLSRRQSDRASEVVLVADYSNGADMVLAQASVETLADLAGRRVSVEPGSLNEVVLLRALDRIGLGRDDVEVVWMPALSMPRAFREGAVDAAVCYPPMALEILDAGGHPVFTTAETPGLILDVLAFDPAVLAARPDDVEAFRRAFFRAQDFAAREPGRADPIIAARLGITVEELGDVLGMGIAILGREDQAAFFGPEGRLDAITTLVDRDLDALERAHAAAEDPE
jgi:NitT/TauT family transport system substrate-binding protein